jgi:hypothetical protein
MSTATSTYAHVVAGVRAAIAAYALALDDGRPDDAVATFCSDGSLDLPGAGHVEGHDALRAVLAAPREPQGAFRHVVVNTHVTEWSSQGAKAISDLIVVSRDDESGWGVRSVGRYVDWLHLSDGEWRFDSRVLTFVS